MPLAKFVLILVVVIGAVGLTVAGGALLAGLFEMPAPWAAPAMLPAVAIVYILWRVVADRMTSKDDDNYDRIPR